MTNLQKAKQIDQWYGNQQLLLPDASINWTAVEYYFASDGVGVVHDLYDPDGDIQNQLQSYVATNTTTRVPIMFVEECLHGVAQAGKTVFPAPVGSAAAFDKELMYTIGQTIGQEARAYGIVQCFAPVIGTAREPRWGRVVEGFGEDVFLTANSALMYVLGAQGGDPSGAALNESTSIIAEPKHYIAHSAPQSGANAAPVHVGRRELLDTFAPQFEWAVRYGGARGIMAAYHELDGVPSCANEYTLTELLRTEWGFQGWVLSDLGAVSMMQATHNTASSPADAIVQFLSAGGNSQYYDYPHEVWQASIVDSVANGTLAQEVLDARVADMLRIKLELGLFDAPYTNASLIRTNVDTQAARDTALRAAVGAVTLLQNNATVSARVSAEGVAGGPLPAVASAPVLPLALGTAVKTLAVIGPSADVIRDGDYSGTGVASNFVTVLEGLQAEAAAAGGTTILYAQGCQIRDDRGVELHPVRHQYLSFAGAAGLQGSYWPGNTTSGPPAFTRLDWDVYFSFYVYGPAAYVKTPLTSGVAFKDGLFSAAWAGTLNPPVTLANATLGVDAQGDPFRLTVNGAVVLDTFANASAPTAYTLPFTAGVGMTLLLEYNKAGGQGVTLQWSLINSEDDGIARAVATALASDAVVLVFGEDDTTVGEGIDSNTLALPGRQLELVLALAGTGVPLVAVLMHGRPLAIPQVRDAVPAIVSTWFSGQAQGTAVAGTLVGRYNPAGRTPMTWPVSVGDLPVYYNAKRSARTGCYYDGCHGVLWPFGHGLSYTSFNLSDVMVSSGGVVGPTDTLVINVTLTNVGGVDGEDVPQLYIHDVVASTTQPGSQLKGFERVFVPAGGAVTVSYTLLPERDLYVVDRAYNRVVEPGLFTFFVAPSSVAPFDGRGGVTGSFSVVTPGGAPFAVRMGPLSDLY